jgi:glutamate synthase (NADPH) large chain
MGLYHESQAKDNCGFGLIAQLAGEASHSVVNRAVMALTRMTHRGAVAEDGLSGDGCGLLMQLPIEFFRHYMLGQGIRLNKRFAVGMVFLDPEQSKSQHAKHVFETEIEKETLSVVAWREVPINKAVCGNDATSALPVIAQAIIDVPSGWSKFDIERRLFMARRRMSMQLHNDEHFYVCSLSCLVIVYKALVIPQNLNRFYPDLADTTFKSAIAVFHQRFSTNTKPAWRYAQPFRFLAHNGEINTISGNRAWAAARKNKLISPLVADLGDIDPLVNMSGSDSSSLDNMLEIFLAGGMDIFRAMRLLVPPAWQSNEKMDVNLKAFYDFNSMHMEPWDGPAGIVMTNGQIAACCLDRNGLRPARYVITQDNTLTLGSEIGLWDYDDVDVIEKGRLGPGEMLAIDVRKNKLWLSGEIDDNLKARHPYREWLAENTIRLKRNAVHERFAAQRFISERIENLHQHQILFGVTEEERHQIIKVMATQAQEAIGSMGDDTPIAVLSSRTRNLFDYFRQKFAQVTNPPIDPLREAHVMSLETCLGKEHNLFQETYGHSHRVIIASPILNFAKFDSVLSLPEQHYKHVVISMNYSITVDLESALESLCQQVVSSVRDGCVLIVLSDRQHKSGRSKNEIEQIPIHAALATGAVHQRLIDEGLRCDANLIIETATARDPHHFAVLIGCGATAVYPYLAQQIINDLYTQGDIEIDLIEARENYRQAIKKGLLKIMSKMGISTISSYRGAMLFEALGLHDNVTGRCFPGMDNRLSGLDFEDIHQQMLGLYRQSNTGKPIERGGLLKFVHGQEFHSYHPDVVVNLQQAVNSGDYSQYQVFADVVNQREVAHIRDLWRLKLEIDVDDTNNVDVPKRKNIVSKQIDGKHQDSKHQDSKHQDSKHQDSKHQDSKHQDSKHQDSKHQDSKQSATHILKRFDSAAMSIGALSSEAHEALAIAMNQINGRSNSGEGGEDPRRFGTERNSKIKQVASGRFGVTAHYLVNAEVLQIKIAQGAKPGEGGQLPGDKVSVEIAKLRHATPGVTLISPPPHHDIYSIEDLAQLIFDLKQVNPKALISVKLVSAPGVGTIAAGVAKAYADFITIAGHDGGTGASPLTSVKYAGSPWELGLAEAHHALVANNMRHKVCLQVDGGLKTGLDVIKAAILGAESFGFGTAPMIALGCKYLRICHLNNCATGIATQEQVLREKFFKGMPEKVVQYFQFVAIEVQGYLADLGVEKLTDLIGRTDLLVRIDPKRRYWTNLNLDHILASASTPSEHPLYFQGQPNKTFDKGWLNQSLLTRLQQAIQQNRSADVSMTIKNNDRSIGAAVAGEIARIHGADGFHARLNINLEGTAGQSLGVWNVEGMQIKVSGDANDYVGKGMSGGQIVIAPTLDAKYIAKRSAVIGNTCLYGATGGTLYCAGRAGERFAVRNSGALAVVEGIGDNGCEYMTGGTVIVLGAVGRNFAAGMSGGFAYVLDLEQNLSDQLNSDMVDSHSVAGEAMNLHQAHIKQILTAHVEATDSEWGQQVLDNLPSYLSHFQLIKPKQFDLERVHADIRQSQAIQIHSHTDIGEDSKGFTSSQPPKVKNGIVGQQT